jgi:alkylation response protein AidB-like acyl-CoA dehydrogenase
MISFEFTPEQEELRGEIRDFMHREIFPRAGEIDEKEGFPSDLVEKMLKPPNSFPAVWVPKRYGGLELDRISICIIVEELGYYCPSCIPFVEVAGLGGLPILFGGSEELKEKWLTAQAKGEAFPSLAMTERGAGSDAGAVRLRAERNGDGYVLNGGKRQISQIDIATHIVVSTRTDPEPAKGARGVSLFLVEKGIPGLIIGERENFIGVRGHKAYRLGFKDVHVPKGNLIGEENRGFRLLMQTLDETRLTVCAGGIGMARATLDKAIAHAKETSSFGRALIDHEAISFPLAEIATEVEAARFLVHKAAWLSDKGVRHTKETSMAKWFAAELAVKASLHAMTTLGGYGCMKEYGAERFFRDA